jgi:hypothetical protein
MINKMCFSPSPGIFVPQRVPRGDCGLINATERALVNGLLHRQKMQANAHENAAFHQKET